MRKFKVEKLHTWDSLNGAGGLDGIVLGTCEIVRVTNKKLLEIVKQFDPSAPIEHMEVDRHNADCGVYEVELKQGFASGDPYVQDNFYSFMEV